MKRWMLIGIGLGCLYSSYAVSLVPETNRLRDSVFRVYRTLPRDTSRRNAVHELFVAHIGKNWIPELLDSALTFAVSRNDNRGELTVLDDLATYYAHVADFAKVETYLEKLRAGGRKVGDYGPYFRAWRSILRHKVAQGDTEAVLLETVRMKKEAKDLGCPEGVSLARITEAQALNFARRYDESARICRKILAAPAVSDTEKVILYHSLALNYHYMGEYERALDEMKKMEACLDKIIRENPHPRSHYRDLLLKRELEYCAIYLAIPRADSLLVHLRGIEKIYSEDFRNIDKISYFLYWGGYYSLKYRWQESLRQFDQAVSYFDGSQPLYEMSVLQMKACVAQDAGRYREAAELYRKTAMTADSLNRDILRRHKEAHQANYKIKKALLDKSEYAKQQNRLMLGTISLLVLLLLGMVMRVLYVHRVLHRSKREIQAALATVDAANKMKESFLRNITYQIRLPLNTVVGLSEVLSTQEGLEPEQVEEYAAIIKRNSGRLIQLVTDVLDLSRLESGMMRFNVQECDIVQLCKDAIIRVEMQENNPVRLTFHSEVETLGIQADTAHFMKLLSFVLAAPKERKTPGEVIVSLVREGSYVRLTVEGSPLLQFDEQQGEHIGHEINRLYLKTFGGTYQIEKDRIVITYPLTGIDVSGCENTF